MSDRIRDTLFAYVASNPPVARTRLGALITNRKGRPIAFGHNQLKSSPFQARFARNPDSIYLHAETAVLRTAIRLIGLETLETCYLWVLRLKHEGPKGPLIPALARPCLGCQRAITTFNIRRTFFTNEEGSFEEL